jgi:hypothetical protein
VPWLPLYLYDEDADRVLEMLNDDPDVMYIVSDGPSRWKAIAALTSVPAGRYGLWHVPSGPLPLLGLSREREGWIADPSSGWEELKPGFDPSTPYFGAGHPGIFWLNLKNELPGSENYIGLSSFEWIGHRYDALGVKASADTDKWWKRLGSGIRRVATKVPRGGPGEPTKPEIYALPNALAAFQRGLPAARNP